MLKLAAYTQDDLQKFSNLLNQMESEKLSIADARTQVLQAMATDRAHTLAAIGRPKAKRRIQPSTSRPAAVCPICGFLLHPVVVDRGDDIEILGCKRCRYSRMEEI